MLDSNVFDTLVGDEETLDAYRRAVALRRIEPFTTQIQEEQLALAPALKRARFKRVPRTVVPAADLPADVLAGGTGAGTRPGATGPAVKPGRLADLVIGRTATALDLVLVTDDRLLRDTLRAQIPAPVVWSAADLLRYIAG